MTAPAKAAPMREDEREACALFLERLAKEWRSRGAQGTSMPADKMSRAEADTLEDAATAIRTQMPRLAHTDRPDAGDEDVERETYRQMHATAVELGYPSILEALEDLAAMREGVDRGMVEREALHKIASFQPKPLRGSEGEKSATLGWNRAGEWAQRIALAALYTEQPR